MAIDATRNTVAVAASDGIVNEIKAIKQSTLRINAGYFVLRKKIFEYIRNGEELVLEPFHRLIEQKQLMAFEYDGFYASMDTFKDKQLLDDLDARGEAPGF